MAAVTGLAMCGCKKVETTQQAPPAVEVVAVAQEDVPIYRDWVGTLQSDVNASISAQVTGYLLSRARVRLRGSGFRHAAAALIAAFALAGIYRVLYVPGSLGQGPFCLFP